MLQKSHFSEVSIYNALRGMQGGETTHKFFHRPARELEDHLHQVGLRFCR